VAVGIVALLIILTINTFIGQIAKANDAKRKADLNRIKIALEEYEKDNNFYPASVTCPTDVGLTPYLQIIPCDPQTKQSYGYENDGTAHSGWFKIYALLQTDTTTPHFGPGGAYNYVQSSESAPI